jgi:hypothetical protein
VIPSLIYLVYPNDEQPVEAVGIEPAVNDP